MLWGLNRAERLPCFTSKSFQTSVSKTDIGSRHRHAHPTLHAHAKLNFQEVCLLGEEDQEEEGKGGLQTAMTSTFQS